MFQLFEESYPFSRATITPPGKMYLVRTLEKILENYKEYYEGVDKYIRNSHWLVRLCKHLMLPLDTPIDEVVWLTRDKMNAVSNIFGIVSYERFGFPVYPGALYGKNATELYINTEEKFDQKCRPDRWKDFKPMRIVRHGHTAITYPYLDGTFEGPEGETAVIYVNTGMLAFQIHLWRLHNYITDRTTPDISEYIVKFLIPSLIDSHVDVMTINRVINDTLELPNDDQYKFRHPFYTVDIESRFNSYNVTLAKQLNKTKYRYSEILNSVPLLTNGDKQILDAIYLPDTLFTVQNRWATFIGYLPIMNFLVQLDNELDNNYNRDWRGKWRDSIRFMRNAGGVNQAFQKKSSQLAASYLEAELDELYFNIQM